MSELSEWLKSCNCYDVKPCYVTLGKSTFEACEYKQDRDPLPLARNQSRYTIHAFYALGGLPRKAYYKYNGDIWYIGGYYQMDNPQYNDYHPFGFNFILFPSNGMDILDKSPDRVNMSVQYA